MAEQLHMFGIKDTIERQRRRRGQAARCLVCGRKLTDPQSIVRKVGPVCMGRAVKIMKGEK